MRCSCGTPPSSHRAFCKPFAEALAALGEADRAGLPVRVGQHEVVDQVVERAAVDGHAQVGAVGEVAGAQPAGVMHLGEEDLLGRPVQGPPLLDAPLQGPQLAVGEAAGEAALQVGEQGLGLQAGVELQLLFELRARPRRRGRAASASPGPCVRPRWAACRAGDTCVRSWRPCRPWRRPRPWAMPCRSRRRSFRTC